MSCEHCARRMRRALWVGLTLLLLGLVPIFYLEGGCDRTPDDDPRPAECKPGDDVCPAGQPSTPSPPTRAP